MANYSINSSINKSISSKGTSTKTRTSNDSAEESGWTAYFEDYDQQNSHCSSSFSCSVSLVSDVVTTVAGAVAGACSSTCDTSLKVPMKLGFKKTRTKEICGGDSLEDTATSPVNSPKVRDVKSNNMDPKQREDQIHSSPGKDTTSENYSKRGCSFDHVYFREGSKRDIQIFQIKIHKEH